MKNLVKMRKWVTPITIGAFLLSAVTGIMLFFKVNGGLIKLAHEWLSWILVVGTVFHVLANWKLFTSYFATHLGRAIIIAFLLLTGACFMPIGGDAHTNRHDRTAEILMRSPLSSVAALAGHTPDEAISLLRDQGFTITGSNESIGEISGKNGKTPANVLDIVF